ncbi:hypothetical protein FOCC_FOCC004036 [Frankliniella occidentalis]|nr:hypothetical protein FOCC_FOCC004036 [Frankliniella occidentalis]
MPDEDASGGTSALRESQENNENRGRPNSEYDSDDEQTNAVKNYYKTSISLQPKSHCGLERFCVAMGMEIISLGSYMDHLHKIMEENEWIREEILTRARAAVRQAYTELDPSIGEDDILDIHVSFDGSWPTRGHSSLSGFCSVIDTLTVLVVDYIILSKHCHVCAVRRIELSDGEDFEKWKKAHEENGECDVNYSGSSGKMEVEGAGILWQRSLEKNKMRYTSVLSDGDAKTISHLNELQPYGEDIIIEKEECVNHVGKRLRTALRNLVQEEKARGVTLRGKKAGALKDTTIVRLQSYYQKAIKSTIPDIPRAQKEINAALDHMNSTDKKPKHTKCPKGVEMFAKVKPIYKRMTEKALLERCVNLSTQNPNECLHSVIWNKCPKEIFVSRRRYEIAATRGVGEFNMGLASMASIRKSGRLSTQIAQQVDARREDQSARQGERTKTRAKKKVNKKKTDTKNKAKEGVTYAPGAF